MFGNCTQFEWFLFQEPFRFAYAILFVYVPLVSVSQQPFGFASHASGYSMGFFETSNKNIFINACQRRSHKEELIALDNLRVLVWRCDAWTFAHRASYLVRGKGKRRHRWKINRSSRLAQDKGVLAKQAQQLTNYKPLLTSQLQTYSLLTALVMLYLIHQTLFIKHIYVPRPFTFALPLCAGAMLNLRFTWNVALSSKIKMTCKTHSIVWMRHHWKSTTGWKSKNTSRPISNALSFSLQRTRGCFWFISTSGWRSA